MWQLFKNYYHLGQALLANIYYGFPGRRITVIGVTGTDGKTTTTNLIYHIFKTAGKKISMISTISAVVGETSYDTGFHTTTPSSFTIQKYLKKALQDGSTHMILEVTSHALDQYRAWGIPFAVGVITNITHEHLDYHKTYDNYVKSKMKLLENAKVRIVNKDDQSFKKISNFKFPISNGKLITYGLGSNADVNPRDFSFKTNLEGEFNIYNCLAAIAVAKQFGIDDVTIKEALNTFPILMGRNEIVYDNDFRVIVDFAHTPNALRQILGSLHTKSKKGRIIHVFGSAGERDASKRPMMGEASSRYADVIILTAEDPRSESVEKIIEEIEGGIENSKFEIQNTKQIQNSNIEIQNNKNYVLEILDRQEAITKAISLAKKGDTVIITGKGHEQSMNFGNGEVSWSEHEAVKNALKYHK